MHKSAAIPTQHALDRDVLETSQIAIAQLPTAIHWDRVLRSAAAGFTACAREAGGGTRQIRRYGCFKIRSGSRYVRLKRKLS